jgi:hypothetical protein
MDAKGDVKYLTASEFADLSLKAQVELRRKYGKIEIRDTEQGLSTGQLNSLKVELKAMTQSQLKGQGITGASDFTQQGLEFNQALERYFFQQYKLALESGADVTNEDAYRRAIELTKTYAEKTVDVNGQMMHVEKMSLPKKLTVSLGLLSWVPILLWPLSNNGLQTAGKAVSLPSLEA